MKRCPECESINTRDIDDERFPDVFVCQDCAIFFTPGKTIETWTHEEYEQHHALHFMKKCKEMWV